MKDRKKPAIRFKGFTEDWEQRKLGEVFKYEQPQAYIVENTDYDGKNDIPVLTAGQSFILGYTDENFGIKEASEKNPVIIFDDFTTSSHYVDFPFKVKSSAMKLLNLNNQKDNIYCAYNVLKSISYLPVSHERHWISTFAKFDILLPRNADEQKQVGQYFSLIDHLITLHQRKYDKLVNIKKSVLEKMFPRDGKIIPDIRFSGFTEDWEQRKLGEIVKEVTRNDSASEAPIMMITANHGFIEQSERYAFNNAGESLKRYILLENGELAYNHGASKLRPYGSCFALTTAEKARIPFVYHCFSAEEQNAEFISIELNGYDVENQLRKIVSSGARMDGLLNISFAEYTSVSVLLPKIDEQNRIADFLSNLDHLITLHQRKLEKLKNIKKSCLEKMFI